MTDIAKTYNPAEVEEKWYTIWEENKYFHAPVDKQKKPYTIMMPPPNVTGILHMGHALQSTTQDLLIRYHRMKGFSSLWMPGTDHAGIATQNVVEKKLRKEGRSREEIGRDEFVEEVWAWKEKHGNIISQQQRKVGSSCDWDRERFTMDEGLSKAVREVFVKLFEQDLIYRGEYIVNWCTYHKTALSDEEVKHKDKNGHLWYVNYPIEGTNDFVQVATTRPETMLGDTAVAVNPEDERYKDVIGKNAILPILDRKLPVIADEHVDPKFGTGAVKITPGHDPNDFVIGERHDLDKVIVINEAGQMTQEAGELFQGMDRFECRKKLIKELEERNFLVKVEDHEHSVGHCYRCDTVIEPYISEQWFLKMKPLADKAIKAAENGDIRFHPAKWEKDYYYWMHNIRDWCISRQLWWGHRIPVWYCDACGEAMASTTNLEKCRKCDSSDIRQDEDVLDTWFSSWLWPFSTLGWPEKTEELSYFYPTSVLVSGYEILFFWIARMVMAGLWIEDEVPFTDIYLTPMIKDEQGRIMSKSLGNGIDPIEMIGQYGADAVRFSLISLSTDGQDIKLAPFKFELGRNFANKIWNAFRFLKLKEDEVAEHAGENQSAEAEELFDRWIISRLYATWIEFDSAIEKFRLNEALGALYDFIWHDFCDWYLELLKHKIIRDPKGGAYSLHNFALPTFKKVIELLHPVMPFITEEIWQTLSTDSSQSIMLTDPGKPKQDWIDKSADGEIEVIKDVVYVIRNIRGEMRVPPARKATVLFKSGNKTLLTHIQNNIEYITNLCNVADYEIGQKLQKPPQSASAVVQGMEIFMPLAGLIDINEEKNRLAKEAERLQGQIKAISNKLSNNSFVDRAPKEIVEKEKSKLDSFSENLKKVRKNLDSLEE